jgi:YopT-type cysteine protease-like protein
LSAFQVAPGNLNEQNICAGLSTEWLLLNGHGNAPDRLATLAPGSAAHRAATERHDIYLAAIAKAHQSGATHPLNDGANTILGNAGLKKLGDAIPVFVESAQDMDEVAQHVTQANTRFLLSLRFMNGHGHAIAATHQGGQTRLFDPNLGEFQASSRDTTQLLKQLATHYESMDLDLGGINMHRVR